MSIIRKLFPKKVPALPYDLISMQKIDKSKSAKMDILALFRGQIILKTFLKWWTSANYTVPWLIIEPKVSIIRTPENN